MTLFCLCIIQAGEGSRELMQLPSTDLAGNGAFAVNGGNKTSRKKNRKVITSFSFNKCNYWSDPELA